ncbi:MAG: hypothetical protein QOD41_3121, partial [Cryptosporangiaceae bacterium]|nr:hypothetical protein [Cryptosporangiaceae bacterium]
MRIRPPGRFAGPVALAAILGAVIAGIALPVAGLFTPGTAAPAQQHVQHVLIVGVPGLRWDDVSPGSTPALTRIAARAGVGDLSVRSVGQLTCPADGWVTLGAGARARAAGAAAHPDGGGCQPGFPVSAPAAAEGGAHLADQDTYVEDNDRLGAGAHVGALADGLRCVGVLGRDAAVGGAHPSGRIDRYAPRLPLNARPFLSACPVTVVGLDAFGLDPAGLPESGAAEAPGDGAATPAGPAGDRRADLARLDASIAALDAARPASSLLLVVGIADTELPVRLHVGIADGPGFGPGWLTSPSTQRSPFAQLTDVAPTAYQALGIPIPPTLSGEPIRTAGGRPPIAASIARLVDDSAAAEASEPLVQPFFTALVVVNLAVIALASVLFRWRARRAVALRRRPIPFGFSPRQLVEVCALWTAAILPASYLANAAPWWRLPGARFVHVLSVLALAAGLTALARAGRWGQSSLGPATCVAVSAAVVLGADVLLGSPMQLNALAGYSPLVAGRFTGLGNLSFAVFAAGSLCGSAMIAQAVPRRWRPLLLAMTGIASILLVAGPGSDGGGVLALAPAALVLVVRGSRIRMSALAAGVAGAVGAVAVTVFAVTDYLRAPSDRSNLGQFVTQLGQGTAGVVIRRKAEANLNLLINSQLTILVLAVLVFVPLVLMHSTGGMRRVFGLYPCVRAGLLATAVAAAIGFAVNDSGVALPAFAVALAVPLAVATTLRVRAGAAHGVLIAPRNAHVPPPPDPAPDPEGAGPHDAEPPGTEPPGTEPPGTEPPGTEPPGTEPP